MLSTNSIAGRAIFAALALLVLAVCTSAQWIAPLNNNPPQKDPNMPPKSSKY
jgi:hypothetical protein